MIYGLVLNFNPLAAQNKTQVPFKEPASLSGAHGSVFIPLKKTPPLAVLRSHESAMEQRDLIALSFPFFGSNSGEDFDLNEGASSIENTEEDPFPKSKIEFIDEKTDSKALIASLDEETVEKEEKSQESKEPVEGR